MDHPIILIEDSNEQRGYGPLFSSPYVVKGLSEGDYSVVGLEDRISIERKSLEDVIGSLSQGRTRFEKEFRRARALDYFAVVIEGRISDLIAGNYRSRATPQSMFETITSWSVKYKRPFLFCEDRTIAARVTESLLLKYSRQFVQAADDVRRAARHIQRSA